MSRIPLIVLGGFLGAGKTTLLNWLLTEAHGKRIAVLVNDFGPINVDASLIADHDGQTISLTNGCICCSIGSGLDAALIRVLDYQPAPELIIIEASGVSDPGRIAQVGLSDPLMQLEAVVVMVDAAEVSKQLDDPLLADTIARQIDAAGLLVLNKMDLVTKDQMSVLKQRLTREFGPIATIETQEGEVPLAALLAPLDQSRPSDATQVHRDGDMQAMDHPFESGSWTVSGVLNADRLAQTLRDLPRSVIRVKGQVITDRHGAAVVHLAGRRVRFERMQASRTDPSNQLVFIGLKGQGIGETIAKALDALSSRDYAGRVSVGVDISSTTPSRTSASISES